MKKPFLKPTAIALLIAITFSNCATIVSKSSYPVGIDTNPAGASVSITDKKGKQVYKGTSPATVVLKSGAGFFSKAEYQVKLSLNGYDEKIVPINYKINGWYFGNILIGGVLGMLIIDPATGAMWKIETPSIDETLIKSTALTTNTPTLKIVDIKDVPQVMKDQLVKIK